MVQAWTSVGNSNVDEDFIAELRWDQSGLIELRFGVDFSSSSGSPEDEETRLAAYNMARSMDSKIEIEPLRDYLASVHPPLDALLQAGSLSRPVAKGNWEQVIRRGFAGAPLEGGKKNSRSRTTPNFYGDGALRFEAKTLINKEKANGHDLIDLVDATLKYLRSQ